MVVHSIYVLNKAGGLIYQRVSGDDVDQEKL